MSRITASDVGTMSDEELARMLNERWDIILGLLRKAGGDVTFTERELVELDTQATVEMYVEPVTRTTRIRMHSTVLAGARSTPTAETPTPKTPRMESAE